MLDKRIFQICLMIMLITASFTVSFGTAEASNVEYHLIVMSTEGGEVIQPEDDVNRYDEETTVVLEADPDDNYEFVEWTGDIENVQSTDSKTTQVDMEDNYTITAEFEKETHELEIDVDGEGEIVRPIGVNLEYEHGESVVIEAEADENHAFLEWTGDTENIEDTDSELTIIEMEDDYDITAEFETEMHTLTIDVDGEGEVLRPGEGDFDYEHGNETILEVEADENYTFVEWTGDIENIDKPESELATIVIEDDYEITAEFEEDYYELSIDVDGEGRVIQPGEGDFGFEQEEKVVIEAEADENYEFKEWTGDIDTIKSPESRITELTMEDDYDITAEFEKKHYELSVELDDEDKGEIIRPEELNSVHEFEDEVILEVEVEDGYEFTGWSGDIETIDDPDSTLAVIEITEDHEITAEFESEEFELKTEWIVIAVLGLIIAFFIGQKLTSTAEESEKSRPKEGVCENCGEIIPIDSKECPECGTPLKPPDLPELNKVSASSQ